MLSIASIKFQCKIQKRTCHFDRNQCKRAMNIPSKSRFDALKEFYWFKIACQIQDVFTHATVHVCIFQEKKSYLSHWIAVAAFPRCTMRLMNIENWVEIYNFPFLWFDAISYRILWNKRKANEAIVYLQWSSISWAAPVVIKQAKNRIGPPVITVMILCISNIQTNPTFDRTAQAIRFKSEYSIVCCNCCSFFLRISHLFAWFSSTFRFDLMCNAI